MSGVAFGYYLMIYVIVIFPFSPIGLYFYKKFKKSNDHNLKVWFAILAVFFLFPPIILIIGVVMGFADG